MIIYMYVCDAVVMKLESMANFNLQLNFLFGHSLRSGRKEKKGFYISIYVEGKKLLPHSHDSRAVDQ